VATTYDTIRDLFLSKITDYDLNSLPEPDINNIFDKYLIASIPKFRHCVQNLDDRDDSARTFNITLTIDEQEILATLCAIEWLNPKILRDQELKNILGNKDFQIYSPSALLKEKVALRTQLVNDVNQLITFYHYQNMGG
jgi:hypothetical protein